METKKKITELKGNWNETKGKLKQKFALLADNDLLLVSKQDEMLDKLQVKLGKTKEEIRAILTSCNTPAEKVENEQNNVTAAKEGLDKASKGYQADIESYRKETAAKVVANDQSIAEFKARIEHEKKDAKADYNKKIAELEQKNSGVKKKMDDYKAEGKEKWELFKEEFSRDTDELGNAFKNLAAKNAK